MPYPSGRIRALKLAALMLAAAFASGGCWLLPKEKNANAPALIEPPEESITTFTLTTGTAAEELSAWARVRSSREENLSFPIAGMIDSVPVDYGDAVKKGQVLMTLGTGDLIFALKQAQAGLAQAKLRFEQQFSPDALARTLRLAELDLETARMNLTEAEERLKTEGITAPPAQLKILQDNVTRAKAALEQSRLNYERVKNDYSGSAPLARQIAATEVQKAQIECDRLQRQLDNAVIRAPFDGTITSLTVDRGSTVAPFANVVTVADTKSLAVVAEVDPAEYTRLKLGMKVRLQMDDGAEEMGRIISLRTVANQETYQVIIRMDNPRFKLVMDDYFNIFYILRSVTNTLLVPNRCLREDAAGQHYLIVLEGTERVDTYVTVGIQGLEFTQILTGAKAGQVVIAK